MYHHVVAAIETDVIAQVSDIILNPPEELMYEALKERLIEQFADSETHRLKLLLQELQLGGDRPTQLLCKMRDFSSKVPEDRLKNLWLQRLPTAVQQILAVNTCDLDALQRWQTRSWKFTDSSSIHLSKARIADCKLLPHTSKSSLNRSKISRIPEQNGEDNPEVQLVEDFREAILVHEDSTPVLEFVDRLEASIPRIGRRAPPTAVDKKQEPVTTTTSSSQGLAINPHLSYLHPTDHRISSSRLEKADEDRNAKAYHLKITKFNYCVAHIPPEAACIVHDIIINPDEEDPYQQLKSESIKRCGESKSQEIRNLLTGEQLGDQKPSELLLVMQRHAESRHISDVLLLELFFQQMPINVQFILPAITPPNAT
ncbi:hypothetical protein HNY73_021222 [Argiope bruennichi]|uniref:DUF7041 domain-containing protein n=1 Tax=Argiope bruennichi TaxID=94029 RepID=A0A8T0EAA7_ARGBR|nr:hypothetical protein HNY73_021222 [Argiope bruennichi]